MFPNGEGQYFISSMETRSVSALSASQQHVVCVCVCVRVQMPKDAMALINAPSGRIMVWPCVHSLPLLLAASSVVPLSTLKGFLPTFHAQQRMHFSGWWEPEV